MELRVLDSGKNRNWGKKTLGSGGKNVPTGFKGQKTKKCHHTQDR